MHSARTAAWLGTVGTALIGAGTIIALLFTDNDTGIALGALATIIGLTSSAMAWRDVKRGAEPDAL